MVIGYLDLIKTVAENPEAVRKNTGQVEKAVDRIVNIIKQLNTVVSKTRLATQSFKLTTLIEGAVERSERELGAKEVVFIDNPTGNLEIASHVEVFETSIAALINNAYESYGDHFEGNRSVGLTISVLEDPNTPQIEIRIEDHGRGISEDIRDHMFEPFISSKHTVGVGMGLTVARHAIRHLGGDLILEDRPGGGTIAIVQHPINAVKGHG